tara:strand:+ start:2123 stop:2488 length:366 start_codon:yes stop_codon:yes gene_type:complete
MYKQISENEFNELLNCYEQGGTYQKKKTTESKMIIERNELEQQLKDNIMEVTFNKISGDKRIMTCTLNASYLPPAKKDDPLTQKKIRKINEEVLVVWDTNAKGFRTFRIANITEVKQVQEA